MALLTYAVIEDIPDVAERLRLEMDRFPGWQHAGSAASVRQARQLLSDHRPSLLFCDWDLVGGSGFEVLQHVATLPGYNPFVVFNTGFQADHPEIAEELVNHYKPDVFINKPYWKKLLEQLEQILADAREKHARGNVMPDSAWVASADGRQVQVNRSSIICIVQDAVNPRHKRIYTSRYPEGLACQLTWPEAEDLLARGGIDYFVTNKRQSIITRPYLLQIEGCYAYLQHVPFKVEIVKDYLRAFHAWAGISSSRPT